MNTQAVEAPLVPLAPPAPDLAGLEPIRKIQSRWPTLLGAGLTVLMILSLGRELFGSGIAGLWRVLPTSPFFYIAFALFYLGPPTFDFIIFRRLWRIPFEGMAALHKKRISNEVLFGYSGEAFFYAWARQRTQMVAAPFGAVKDVAILSAVAGNVLTLAMVVIALPFALDLLKPHELNIALGSIALIFAMSLPFFIFSRRVFSLSRKDLWYVFGMQAARIVAGSVFVALAWHFAMPEVSLGMWLILAAGRLLAGRLPLVPSKDLLFASFAGMLIGQDAALSELLALTAGLTLLVHVSLIGAFGLHSLFGKKE